MSMVDTSVTGDVVEHHFRCMAGHEFSVLAKAGLAIAPSLGVCVVDGCSSWSQSLGDNSAEVSKNPTDLLEH